MGPKDGLDGRGKYRHHRNSIPEPVNPWRVAIPTELSRPTSSKCPKRKCTELFRVPSTSGFSCQSPRQKEKTVNPAVVGITLLPPHPLTNCANISLTELTNWGVGAWIQTRHTDGLLRCFKSGTSFSTIIQEISFDA